MDNVQNFQINGRLGNQLFQFAHIYTLISKSDNKKYSITCDYDTFGVDTSSLEIKPISVKTGVPSWRGNNFLGWNESETLFDGDIIKGVYSISESLKKEFSEKYGKFDNTLFISVRRGDFFNFRDRFVCLNGAYYDDMYENLGKTYDTIFLSSDDFGWCKENIHIPNVTYIDNEIPYNIIMLASLCKDFIISSSTFSWWCAWLGEKNGGRILCPNHHFRNGFLVSEDKIYYPERWERQEVEEKYCEK